MTTLNKDTTDYSMLKETNFLKKVIKVHLGNFILKYKTPAYLVKVFNSTYERLMKKKKLPLAHKNLAGKIKNEHSLYSVEDTPIQGAKHPLVEVDKHHNFLSEAAFKFFSNVADHYLNIARVKRYRYRLHSVWINEMKEGEYNPIHNHFGSSEIGLASILILKLPKNYGEEATNKDAPTNGQLAIVGNGGGQFYTSIYAPQDLQEGDFLLFPYDVKHCVYPFKGKEKRRTLSANIDIHYT